MTIEILDMNDENFEEEFEFAMKSIGGSSDYNNDRNRPYNGQAHTSHGERGEQIVTGLTMRDISDCIVQGFLSSSCNPMLSEKVKEINKDFIGTEYANKNNWRYRDVYKINIDIDPIAVIQNTMCHVESMMDIFPNLSEKTKKESDDLMTLIEETGKE